MVERYTALYPCQELIVYYRGQQLVCAMRGFCGPPLYFFNCAVPLYDPVRFTCTPFGRTTFAILGCVVVPLGGSQVSVQVVTVEFGEVVACSIVIHHHTHPLSSLVDKRIATVERQPCPYILIAPATLPQPYPVGWGLERPIPPSADTITRPVSRVSFHPISKTVSKTPPLSAGTAVT